MPIVSLVTARLEREGTLLGVKRRLLVAAESHFPSDSTTVLPTISSERNVLMDQRIAEVFNAVFQVSPEQVTDSLSPQDVTGWDSLGHVRLVAQLQDEFGVEFEVTDIMRMENVAAIKKILSERLV